MLGCPKLPSDSCSGYHHVELAVRLIEGKVGIRSRMDSGLNVEISSVGREAPEKTSSNQSRNTRCKPT